MEKSKVYYTSMKVNSGTNLLKKLDHLVREAGISNIDFENKYTAIKIHFGEPGNLAFLRPNYAKVIVDLVKELGGKPFLTDCNTLYVGRRKNALDHLDAAYENGFSPFSTGCHVIIADGLKGTDETLVPVNGEYIKEAKIGHAVMDADIIISLNHFKGHESTDSAAPSKTWAWAAAPAPARWKCTAAVSQSSTRRSASPAENAARTVRTMQSALSITMVKTNPAAALSAKTPRSVPSSTTTSASAADAASAPARRMQ